MNSLIAWATLHLTPFSSPLYQNSVSWKAASLALSLFQPKNCQFDAGRDLTEIAGVGAVFALVIISVTVSSENNFLFLKMI